MFNKNIFIMLAVVSLSGCGTRAPNPEVEACTQRGITYFKEVGSYPRLQTWPNVGRPSEEVARERCNRATTAF